MALDLSEEALNRRIDALRGGFAGYHSQALTRNIALLRAFSPEFDQRLQEFDQWPNPIKAEDDQHARGSYNLARPVAEMWAALEAEELPAIRWEEPYAPLIPSMDQQENAARQATYRASRLVAQTVASMREQALARHHRRMNLDYHFYRATLRKNVYGHAWSKVYPELPTRKFCVIDRIDPSTAYPVYSAFDSAKLDAMLVAYRRSAQSVNSQFPGSVTMSKDGLTVEQHDYYTPTNTRRTDAERAFVWIEDYWTIDSTYEEVTDDGPVTSIVVNAQRVNGKVVSVARYPGWTRVPYFLHENEDERERHGFSDVGTILPIQDSINRFLSQQQDVIFGESRPKFKYRGDADRTIVLGDEQVVSLDPDEDIEQIAVHLDVFPTQVHGQQLLEMLARTTGLNDTVWGRLAANSNSGRALSTAWRSVAARMVPRVKRNDRTLHEINNFMLDCMELYGWDNARELYQGNRDYELDWPNKEPRDFLEVTTDAINKLQAGIIDSKKAMELTGEQSPDQMDEDVRAEFTDTVRHPDKAQSYLLLQNLEQDMAIKAQQAQLNAQSAQAQLSQLAATPPGGAPSGATGQQAGAARQARIQAAQQAAPTAPPGAPQPATQAGQTANASQAQTKVSTLVQDGGAAQNRIISQQPVG